MLRRRLSVFLMIHKGNLYKSTKFSDFTYVGDPLNAVKIFSDFQVDELIFVDIDATVKNQEINFHMIEDIASVARMPLCYGGGIRKASHAERIVSLGVEKISICSESLKNPTLIKEISDSIGSQSVVACLDIKKGRSSPLYMAYTHNGSKEIDMSILEIIDKLIESGVGEILVNNMDLDGTSLGPDVSIIEKITEYSSVPVTCVGGVGLLSDIEDVIKNSEVSGIAAGTFWCFKGPHKAVLMNYIDKPTKMRILN